jgi:SHS2 domain-containing protein
MAAFTAGDDTELLVAAMEEVMYLLDARGEVPVAATVSARDGDGVDVVYATAPLRTVETIGPVPKGVTRHALGFAATDGMWRCTVLIDV